MWEIASEGARRDFGRLNNTPPPEAHELRGAQLSIFISCARVFSFIQIIYENTPSNELDELSIISVTGEWRFIPYMDAVFKPIKDAYNNWINGIKNYMNELDFSGNGEARSRGDSSGGSESTTNADAWVNELLEKIFGGNFFYILIGIGIVISAVSGIVGVFLKIVSGLAGQVADFLKPLIMKAITSIIAHGKEIAATLSVSAIFGVLYSFVPEKEGWWNKNDANNVFTIFSLAFSFIELGIHKAKDKFNEYKSDAGGLIISLMGIAISLGIGNLLGCPELGALFGLIFSIIGCIYTIANDDWFDKFSSPPLNWIEETISGISVAISVSTLIDSIWPDN